MTNYEKLVETLRWTANEYKGYIMDEYDKDTMNAAADAIEASQAEVKRLKDSNEELREKQTFIDHYGTEWLTSAKDVPTAAYEHGYADGMAEVKAQLPKRGEWVRVEDELPNDGDWAIFTNGKVVSVERFKEDAYNHFYPASQWFDFEDATAWMPLPEPPKEAQE